MSSSNRSAQNLVWMLEQDGLTRETLHQVNTGPFGAAARSASWSGDGMDLIYNYHGYTDRSGSERRPEKQYRASRETVSNETPVMSMKQIMLWEDRLSSILTAEPPQSASEFSSPSSAQFPMYMPSGIHTPLTLDMSQLHAMNISEEVGLTRGGGLGETTDGMGHISMDENQELRYHSNASGYPLLNSQARFDGRNEGGIWKFPMARAWPAAPKQSYSYPKEDDITPQMPPREEQERLIKAYFTYFHPSFPVIHKAEFLEQFRNSLTGSLPHADKPQPLSKLLLFSMLAVAGRYCASKEPPPPEGVMLEMGCDFAATARDMLTKIMHHSHPTTCQSLLILGVREFAIGSTEEGWLLTGMAIRMDKYVFSDSGKETRRAIWWCLCIADRHMSAFLGRPVSIHEADFEVSLPSSNQGDAGNLWQPLNGDPPASNFTPVPGHFDSCFIFSSSLAAIVADIISVMYPIKVKSPLLPETWNVMVNTLHQWYSSLPLGLQYSSSAALSNAPPHVVTLHVNYWYAMLMVHRALLPKMERSTTSVRAQLLTRDSMQNFEACHAAAIRLSDIVDCCREKGTLQYSSPFMHNYVLNAGIVHVLILSVGLKSEPAMRGLVQCLDALRALELFWPGAALASSLLRGIRLSLLGDSLPWSPSAPTSGPSNVGMPEAMRQHSGGGLYGLEGSAEDPSAVMYEHNPHWYESDLMGQTLAMGGDLGPLAYGPIADGPNLQYDFEYCHYPAQPQPDQSGGGTMSASGSDLGTPAAPPFSMHNLHQLPLWNAESIVGGVHAPPIPPMSGGGGTSRYSDHLGDPRCRQTRRCGTREMALGSWMNGSLGTVSRGNADPGLRHSMRMTRYPTGHRSSIHPLAY
ncbi:hypothetical protein OE88DRAFT_1728269, partial [Heliocybe sulcata]